MIHHVGYGSSSHAIPIISLALLFLFQVSTDMAAKILA